MLANRTLSRIDVRVLPILAAFMAISLLIISSYSVHTGTEIAEESFLTPMARIQLRWFCIGTLLFFATASFDYNKLREWTWPLYALMLISLLGLFFTDSVQRVHRWYRIPFIGISVQPSECAKLIVVITLSWFLERRKNRPQALSTALLGGLIVGIPFVLILKQPDLGSALVLFPIALVMFYFGGLHPWIIKVMSIAAGAGTCLVALIFSGVIDFELLRPYALVVMKEYQFDRLDPHTHHQMAALTAIAVGGITGTGWRKSEYTAGGWLPTPYTDSVFPAFGEEFGLIGLIVMLLLYYALIYFSFQVTVVAKDHFGRLLSAGITVYLAMHVIINIGMMTGFLPITGVPLVMVTYGGSSIMLTMTAIGLLQSIYSRRFMF